MTDADLMETTFKIHEGTAIECLVCGMISHSPKDVEHLYCGKCHRFHDTRRTPPLTHDAYRLLAAIQSRGRPPEGLTDSPHAIMVSFFQRGLLKSQNGMVYVTDRGKAALEQHEREM